MRMLVVILALVLCCGPVCAGALEGYDNQKLSNPDHKTPKYLFGRVAQNYSLDSVKDKASAEELLKKMLPDLVAAGMIIEEVKGDKIKVKTEIGWEWVDVIRGAGAPNPGFWWGSEGKPIDGTTTGGTSNEPGSGTTGESTTSSPGSSAGGLSTVPDRPEYGQASIDTSSDERAIISAATWVKEKHPDLFPEGDDRDKAYVMMTHVIGILRAKGFDVHRVVNHPSRPVGHPLRYGSDALVLKGKIYDCYAALGDPNRSTPQALYVGPYAAGRAKE